MYKEDLDLLVEDCIAIFHGGSGTVAMNACSMLHRTVLHKAEFQKVTEDLDKFLNFKEGDDIFEKITYDSLFEVESLSYF